MPTEQRSLLEPHGRQITALPCARCLMPPTPFLLQYWNRCTHAHHTTPHFLSVELGVFSELLKSSTRTLWTFNVPFNIPHLAWTQASLPSMVWEPVAHYSLPLSLLAHLASHLVKWISPMHLQEVPFTTTPSLSMDLSPVPVSRCQWKWDTPGVSAEV